jgi:hypothetical protein
MAKVGSTLTISLGNWDSGVAFTYNWLRSDGSSIGSGSSYQTTGSDLNKTIWVSITGSRAGSPSVTRVSNATAIIQKGAMTNTIPPSISGVTEEGGLLTANVGTWNISPSFSFQWLRNGITIPGATSSAYKITANDANNRISVRVTGTQSGYESLAVTSSATDLITAKLKLTPTPTISGRAWVGYSLYSNPGTWDAEVTLSYQWLRDGIAIPGATGPSYLLLESDLGMQTKISLVVTGSKTNYPSVSKTSSIVQGVGRRYGFGSTPTVDTTVILFSTTWERTNVFQWFVNGAVVGTSDRIFVNPEWVGQSIYATINGERTSLDVIQSNSGLTLEGVRVSGVTSPGQTLTASWYSMIRGNSFDLVGKIQWYKSGVIIPGATSKTYVLTSNDVGSYFTFTVTVDKQGYVSRTATSTPTASVASTP